VSTTWSPQQEQALKAVGAWLADKSAPQVFRLFGFAGTGKTTLAVHLAQDLKRVVFGAFTGKAALVMRRKGCTDASTIHSLIYKVKEDADNPGAEPEFILNPDSEVKRANLVVIDECSMCGEALAKDLLSFGSRVLVLGDPAQLPPVKDAGFFTEQRPDFMLTEIHRQALDNPIIRLSMDVREGRALQRGEYGATRVIAQGQVQRDDVLAADQVLVGLNRTRQSYNRRIRELRGFAEQSPYPVASERLICLRNDRKLGLLNGGMWTVKSCGKKNDWLKLALASEDDAKVGTKKVTVHPAFFDGTDGDLDWQVRRQSSEFTFGHAITVHKSQGSQFDNVFLFNESGSFREDARRWLYTGITRAAERITIVEN
jgi:exodeoxyribonuclease-5